MNSPENIISLLPHRPPFVMIGELLFADDHCTRTGFRVNKDNIFVEKGKWSEAGLLENMAQTVAAGAGNRAVNSGQPVEIGFIGGVKNFEVLDLPSVDDQLVTEVTVRDKAFNMIIVEGKIWRNDALIARCEMNIFVGSQL